MKKNKEKVLTEDHIGRFLMCIRTLVTANVFSQSVTHLFIYLMVAFKEQTFLIVTNSNLFLMIYHFCVIYKKSLFSQGFEGFWLCFLLQVLQL